MRSEQEMLDLILDTARQDERIRAVILNGSRANPNAPPATCSKAGSAPPRSHRTQ